MTTTRMLLAAVMIAALAAPTAQAQPADTHVGLARTDSAAQRKQDLRSADAQDAAVRPRHAGRAARPPLPGPPTWPVHPQAIAPVTAVKTTDGSGIDWMPIVIGIAAGLLAIGGLVARNARRPHRPRVTV